VASAGSCGGGGFDGGISGTGIVYGPITALGSIVVNDITFDVSGAEISVNGSPAAAADLRLGMLVTVRGSIDMAGASGTADMVDFDATLEGPVEATDVAAGTLQVLSQLIITDVSTRFDGASLAELKGGDVVEVSGFLDGDGLVRATRVALEDDQGTFEVEGVISGLDQTSRSFAIGQLLIDYSTAEIDNAPAGGLADGMRVEVKASSAPVGGVLAADRIKVSDDGVGGSEGEEIEIEGFVTVVTSPTEFTMSGNQKVRITGDTRFEGGAADDIVVNARLEAEGRLDAQSVLVAEEIDFKD
jgi:hypothetical protein